MKRKTVTKVCYAISIILLLCFIVKTIMDGIRYDSIVGSAPFEVYILVNAIYFVLPAVISFVVGWLINRKSKP